MKALLLAFLSLAAYTAGADALACSVLNVSTDETVLVGRNHDWWEDAETSRYVVEFVPGAAGAHGAVFGVARFRGIIAVFEGMNDRGLFAGIAAVPRLPVPRSPQARVMIGTLVRHLLEEAATVEEATAVARRWNPEFYGEYPDHIMVVDASGKSVVLEWVGGELRIVEKQGRFHHMTNAYLSPAEPAVLPYWAVDGRYDTIRTQLEGGGGTSIDGVFSVLSSVTQTAPGATTETSFVYDLRARTATLAFRRGYDRRFAFRLDEELARGLHSVVLRELSGGTLPAAPHVKEALIHVRSGEVFRSEPGRADVQLTALGYDTSLTCALDGRIAFSRFELFDPAELAASRLAVHVIGPTGEIRQLTSGDRADVFTVWPRGGGDQLYVGRLHPVPAKRLVYRTRASAKPGDEVLVSDPAHDERVFTSFRDGRILVESDRDGGFRLYALRPGPDGRPAAYQPIRTAFRVRGRLDKVTLSPDERQVLFEMAPGNGLYVQGQARAYRARFDARTLTISAPTPIGTEQDHAYLARWGKDGSAFYYQSDRTGSNLLYRYDLRKRSATAVTDGALKDSYCVPGMPH